MRHITGKNSQLWLINISALSVLKNLEWLSLSGNPVFENLSKEEIMGVLYGAEPYGYLFFAFLSNTRGNANYGN